MNKRKKKRYQNIPSQKGIRKDRNSGKYLVQIRVFHKSISKTFVNLDDAIKWRDSQKNQREYNTHKDMTLGEVIQLYLDYYKAKNKESSYVEISKRISNLNRLFGLKMRDIRKNTISSWLRQSISANKNNQRYSFDNELKSLQQVFEWFRFTFDEEFLNPIMRGHYEVSRFRKKTKKSNKVTEDEIILFMNNLSPHLKDFAIFQFICGLRIAEAIGFQTKDLTKDSIKIGHQALFDKKKHVKGVSEDTKTKVIKSMLYGSGFLERLNMYAQISSQNGSSFVFTENGEPFSYRHIQYHYQKTLEKIGIFHKCTVTHFIRHAAAQITRRNSGSIEEVAAVTGHIDLKMAEHYAPAEVDQDKLKLNQDKLLRLVS